MKAKQYEGYTITDEIRIGNIRLAVGESRDGPVPYITLESEFENVYRQPHYLLSRIAAEVDLIKRAVTQMKRDLKSFSADMQTMLQKDGDSFEL